VGRSSASDPEEGRSEEVAAIDFDEEDEHHDSK
jgi:hypothetical protein